MNKRHILSFLSVAFTFVIFFTGCKSFDPNERGPLDQKTDEENFAHIKEIIHSDNSILKKKVKIRIAPMKYKYYHERNRRVSPEQNKELLGIINSQLISMFQSIKDFEIVNPDTNKNHSDEGKKSKSNVWTVTYSINKIEFADNCHTMRTLISDTPEEYEENLKRYKENISKRYSVIFSLELHLISPNGDKYFTFKNTVESKGRSNSPDFQFIKAELGKTFPYVSGRLYRKLLPPVYVVETCNNGRFAKLSIGSDYRIKKGQKIYFYRTKKVRSLGDPSGFKNQRTYVGKGVVGENGALVEKDHAWVYIDNNDTPETNRVHTYTSATLK